jgi:hypothetical protein
MCWKDKGLFSGLASAEEKMERIKKMAGKNNFNR